MQEEQPNGDNEEARCADENEDRLRDFNTFHVRLEFVFQELLQYAFLRDKARKPTHESGSDGGNGVKKDVAAYLEDFDDVFSKHVDRDVLECARYNRTANVG